MSWITIKRPWKEAIPILYASLPKGYKISPEHLQDVPLTPEVDGTGLDGTIVKIYGGNQMLVSFLEFSYSNGETTGDQVRVDCPMNYGLTMKTFIPILRQLGASESDLEAIAEENPVPK